MRTIVYIDAFNLYYGACRAPGRRWLDPSGLATRLLPNDEIVEIGYFTANVKKDLGDPGVQDRQRLYHRALQTIPKLEIFLGRYISKEIGGELLDPAPGEPRKRIVRTYEEKGTDVNLATRLRRASPYNSRQPPCCFVNRERGRRKAASAFSESLAATCSASTQRKGTGIDFKACFAIRSRRL